jgi:hypothetical protein
MGVLDLILVIPFLIASIVLIIDCGVAVLAKQQVSYAADMAAQYLSQNFLDPNAEANTKTIAQTYLKHSGCNFANVKVTISSSGWDINGITSCTDDVYCRDVHFSTVAITAECMFLGVSNILPQFKSISDTGIAIRKMPFLLGVSAGPRPGTPDFMGAYPNDIYNRPEPDQTLWLPIVHPKAGTTPGYVYQVLKPSAELCTHAGKTLLSGSYGHAIPNTDVEVGLNDPR